MELKTIENIIENLKTQGFKPTHQTVKKYDTEVRYQSSYVLFQHNTDVLSVDLTLPIHYDITFDQTNIDYLNKKVLNTGKFINIGWNSHIKQKMNKI